MILIHRSLIALIATAWLAGADQALAQDVAQVDERQVVAGPMAPETGDSERSGPVSSEPEATSSGSAEAQPDRNRNQAIARALLLLMSGGSTARPFPLLPK
jgi:hypothetical protein